MPIMITYYDVVVMYITCIIRCIIRCAITRITTCITHCNQRLNYCDRQSKYQRRRTIKVMDNYNVVVVIVAVDYV